MLEFDYLISIMGSKLSNMFKDQMFIAAKKVLKTKHFSIDMVYIM